MNNKQIILPVIIFLFVAVVAGTISALIISRNTSNSGTTKNQNTNQNAEVSSKTIPIPAQITTNEVHPATIANSSIGIEKVSNNTARISIQDSTNLNAYEITINFNPEEVEITKLTPDSVWTNINTLESTIDNKNGTATIAAGKGFNGSNTNKNSLITFEYKLKASSTTITIDTEKSKLAFKDKQGTSLDFTTTEITLP